MLPFIFKPIPKPFSLVKSIFAKFTYNYEFGKRDIRIKLKRHKCYRIHLVPFNRPEYMRKKLYRFIYIKLKNQSCLRAYTIGKHRSGNKFYFPVLIPELKLALCSYTHISGSIAANTCKQIECCCLFFTPYYFSNKFTFSRPAEKPSNRSTKNSRLFISKVYTRQCNYSTQRYSGKQLSLCFYIKPEPAFIIGLYGFKSF